MNIFKKLQLYIDYRRIVFANEEIITGPQYMLRIDLLGRMYTVINVPPDVAAYGPKMIQEVTVEYTKMCNQLFIRTGLYELVSTYVVAKQDEHNYLVVFGYRFMDPRTIATWLKYLLAGVVGTVAAAELVHILSNV